tara:strand:- start:4375 stop:6939 length:2565 start_codon:yes stop_codon:yes gene_type:complete
MLPLRNLASLLILLATALPLSAQERQRNRADRDVKHLLEEKADTAKWRLGDGSGLLTNRKSRFFDSQDPDAPAPPPDDPTAHQLMLSVDGKKGPTIWNQDGTTNIIESETWRQFLPADDEGRIILDLENAMMLALLHSRTYQNARETLYLNALDVSEQRYAFDSQFGFRNNSNRVSTGGNRAAGENDATNGSSSNTMATNTDFGINRRTATGAELVGGLANSILWDFSGSSDTVLSSVVNFGVVQPLLRFRARDFVLEDLTQSERNLLANVRRMKQFQQGFYIDVVSGQNVAEGPSRGQAGESASVIAGTPSSGGRAGGFLGLLQTKQQIRNQEASVAALRDSLAQLQAAFDAGRISNRLQVDQARQALYNGQSSLLTSYAAFDSSIDAYKVSLGLPPDLETVVDEELLERFNLVDPAVSALQSETAAILDSIRRRDAIATPQDLADQLIRLEMLESRIDAQIVRARKDVRQLRESLPNRRSQLAELKQRPELQNVYMDPALFDPKILSGVADQLEANLNELERGMNDSIESLTALREVPPPPNQLERARDNVTSVTTGLSSHLLQLSLIQAAARLESVTLRPVQIEFDDAYSLAESNRLDWMNARAGLVDSWRKIAVDAEALKNGLNLIVNGDVPTTGTSAFNFDEDGGRIQIGLEIDTPITKLNERNNYRETLISYQRARRDFIQFEDQVSQSLRNSLRIVRLSQLNFEVRRAAVRVAIAQVDLARLRLNEPPKPGQGGAQFGATTARDLVSALGDLLDAQNDFLSVWVSFEVLRMLLDYELGSMRLDDAGLWVDPETMTAESLFAATLDPQTPSTGQIAADSEEPVVEVSDLNAEPNSERKRGFFSFFRRN